MNNLLNLKAIKSKIGSATFFTGAFGLTILASGFLVYHYYWPQAFDATGYLNIAEQYRANGILATHEEIRTFGYPWLLSLLISVAKFITVEPIIIIFIFQLGCYWLAAVVLTKVLSETSIKNAKIVYLGLCFNIFLIPYLSVSLTDSLYTSLSIAFFAGLVFFGRDPSQLKELRPRVFFWISLLASFLVVLRPASIWIFVLTLATLIVSALFSNSKKLTNVALTAAGLTPVIFQTGLNWLQFSRLTFQPAYDLGKSQAMCGLANLKYATRPDWPTGQEFYSSKALIGTVNYSDPFTWYLSNPVQAMELFSTKLIAAFDFDYLVPYPYSDFSFSWLTGTLSLTILSLGLARMALDIFGKSRTRNTPKYSLIIFFFGWASVSLVAMPELRFSLPVISIFMVGALMFLANVRGAKNWLILVTYFLISVSVLLGIANFIREQSGLTSTCF